MTYSLLIEKALQKCLELHAGQTRKNSGTTPFAVHPIEVAMFLMPHTQDPVIIAATLLHDTLEDTKYTKEELFKDFGTEVGNLVLEVTEPPRAVTPWKERKLWYINHLREASLGARMISCADKINNLASMIAAYRDIGELLWERFNSDKTIWYYHEILEVLKTDSRITPLVQVYSQTLDEAHRTFGS